MSGWGDDMGYYSNLHILRQSDWDDANDNGWNNEYDFLIEDLYAELEFCNEHRTKNWNDQFFAAGLANVMALRQRIEKLIGHSHRNCPDGIQSIFIWNLPVKKMLYPMRFISCSMPKSEV